MDQNESTLDNRNQALVPTPVSKLDKFWIESIQKLAQGSIASAEDAAKQIIAIISLLQTIYFAAISFSNLKNALNLQDPLVFLFLSPIALWLIALSLAILVFLPKPYYTNLESPSKSATTFNDLIAFKQKILFSSYIVLALGFLMLLVSVFVYMYLIQVPAKP